MAGVNVASNGEGRRPVDSEINMLPMIDLLLVAIFFLLNMAVVTEFDRVNVNAMVPGNPKTACDGADGCPAEKRLRVDMRNKDKFVLTWMTAGATPKEGDVRDVPRVDDVITVGTTGVVRFPLLAASISEEWKRTGVHRETSDHVFDQAVLQTDDATPFASIIGAIDAVNAPQRVVTYNGASVTTPAFAVTFATH